MTDNKSLEQFYEAIILPRYRGVIQFGEITWTGHGKVGLDAWAHYFRSDGKEYVLVYEDYPGESPFDDELSHEVVKLGDEASIELKFSDGKGQVPNVVGWFTLFVEKHT